MNFYHDATSGYGKEALPSNLDDEQWASVAPYLKLLREDAPQRAYALRDVLKVNRP